MVSSKTLLQSLAVTDVEASILGLELISISHGWRSSVSMKSAPYSSNDDCNNPQSLDTVWRQIHTTLSHQDIYSKHILVHVSIFPFNIGFILVAWTSQFFLKVADKAVLNDVPVQVGMF